MADKEKKQLSIDIKDENTQVTLGAIVFLFILILLIIFLIRPTINSISNKKQTIEEYETAITALDGKIKQLETANQNYTNVSTQLGVLEEAVPSEARLTELMKILEKNASEVVTEEGLPLAITKIFINDTPDVIPENASPSASTTSRSRSTGSERQDISLQVTVRGDYEAARSFIQRIKANRRNFQVSRLTLSAPKDRQGRVLDVSVTLTSFYYSN